MKVINKFIVILLILNFSSKLIASDNETKEKSEKKVTTTQELDEKVRLNYKNPQTLLDNYQSWMSQIEKFSQEKLSEDTEVDKSKKNNLNRLKNELDKQFTEGQWCTGKKVLENIRTTAQEETVFLLTLENIVNLVWYFYALAVEQGKSFIEGTFVIEDKNNLIFNSLESSTENYPRISSHFKDLNQFGIDIPEDKRQDLFFPPYNPQKQLPKYTILFGQIKPELIFIKPESFGISALKDQLMHLVEYLEPRENEAKGMRKERIPKDIISAWNEFLITKFGVQEKPSWIPTMISGPDQPNNAKIFIKTQKGNMLIIREVNTSKIAQKGIGAIREALEFAIEFQDNKLKDQEKNAKQKLIAMLDKAGKEKERIGNEIILTDKELNEGLKECKI